MSLPPALVDDAMREIFKRVPPDDPKSLVRAAVVCTSWRRILSDADFTHEYRAFHRAPPMLGFLHNTSWRSGHQEEGCLWSNFVSTVSFRPPACRNRRHWRALDSRHGLVLFHTPKRAEAFVVCDLVTGDQWAIHAHPGCHDIIWWKDDADEYKNRRVSYNAAVLCAKDRCDHLNCHGGPFMVALVGSDVEGNRRIHHTTIYSSESCQWSDVITIELPNAIADLGHSAVVGNNKVYFPCRRSDSVVEYNTSEQILSAIVVQFEDQDQELPYIELMGLEDGMLLFAAVMRPRLYLWSMEAGSSKAVAWARRRVIDLEPLLPPGTLFAVSVIGFAEGVGLIFQNTLGGVFTVELSS